MKDTLIQNQLAVKQSPLHGYGVFALKDIAPGEIIEECYGIDFYCDNHCLHDYTFAVDDGVQHGGRMLTGFGAIYNHSETPNAKFVGNVHDRVVTFTALKPIRKGEEIVTNYGESWFDARRIIVKRPSVWHHPFMKTLHRLGFVMIAYAATLQCMDWLAQLH